MKQMTKSEFVTWLQRSISVSEVADELVGVTIVPDPEPRPDFRSMNPRQITDWMTRHGNNEGTISVEQLNQLIAIANDLADQMGLAK